MREPGHIEIVPANEASWEDLQAILGARGEAVRCQCQYFKLSREQWRSVPVAERADRLRAQTRCGDPDARTTAGLVAYLGGEPAGWCAVEPRPVYVRLQRSRVVWSGRGEDLADDSVWAVTCFVTRVGYRRRGVSAALTRAAVGFARQRGARAIEGYPMITKPGEEISFVGTRNTFADAGFTEITRPTPRRAVMRIDF